MKLLTAICFVAAASLASIGTANAGLYIETNDGVPHTFDPEQPGAPVGTTGWTSDANLIAHQGRYRFEYRGAGTALSNNYFFIDENGNNSLDAGEQAFCNHALPQCGGSATAIGTTFELDLGAGDIPFVFFAGVNADGTGGTMLTNSDPDGIPDPAYDTSVMVAIAGSFIDPPLTCSDVAPCKQAYIGLTDLPGSITGINTGTGDHDFEDLVVLVTQIPEPVTLVLFGLGLIGLGIVQRRRLA
jgi:hypothetical protein